MNNVEKNFVEGNKINYRFTIDSGVIQKEIDNLFEKNLKRFSVKGFRQGKAPMKVVREFYKDDIFYNDVFNIITNREYAEYMNNEDVLILSRPIITIQQMEKDEDLIFTSEFVNNIDFELGDYKEIDTQREESVVAEEDIISEIEIERGKNARIISIDDRKVQNGDIVLIDYLGIIDGLPLEGGQGKDQELTIGSYQFIPGFEEQLIGMDIGETKEITCMFPNNYRVTELSNKEANFTVTINEIKEKILPEVDDEFVRDVSEYESLEEYRGYLKNKLTKSKEKELKSKQQVEFLDKVIEKSKFDIPKEVLDYQVETSFDETANKLKQIGMTVEDYSNRSNKTIEELKDELIPQSEKVVKVKSIINKIFNLENLEVTEDDFDELYAEIADVHKTPIESVKQQILGYYGRRLLLQDLKAKKVFEKIMK